MSISNSIKRKNLPTAAVAFRMKEKKAGKTRLEIPMTVETKEAFLAMAKAKADDYLEPQGELGRLKKAKIALFQDMVSNQFTSFEELKRELEHLKADNQRRYASLYDPKSFDQDCPIPAHIDSLPDDHRNLKQLLSKYFTDNESLRSELNHVKWFSERTEKTAEVLDIENDRLRNLLIKNNIPIN